MNLAHTNDGLLVTSCHRRNTGGPPSELHTFAKDGSMDELATVPVLTNYAGGLTQIAVHQETQRMYGIVGADHCNAVVLLDADLQIIATIETVKAANNWEDTPEAICDLTVHGDQVIVLTSNSHPEGSGLRLLDLNGRFLRTIAAEFRDPYVVTASHGRAFVVDDDDDDVVDDKKVLHVIDIQSGDILQRVHVDLEGDVSAILVDRDEVFISFYPEFRVHPDDLAGSTSKVVVLRYAGSEA